jgi:hypothetical protein
MTSASAPAQSVVAPAHDKNMAAESLSRLDPVASRFTFQFFADCGDAKAQIFHETLEEVWPRIIACNTPEGGHGVFITVNETDFNGRRSDNIVRARALFVDADGESQVQQCVQAVKRCDATPSMMVQSSASRAHLLLGVR